MNISRVSFNIVIGIDLESSNFDSDRINKLADEICCYISTITSGCTYVISNGFWANNGENYLDVYSDIKRQKNIDIKTSVVLEKQSLFLEKIKNFLKKHETLSVLHVAFIHIESYKTQALHYKR